MTVETGDRSSSFSADAHPWVFLGLTLGLTWLVEFLAAAIDGFLPRWGVTALRYLGGIMPLAVAMGLARLKHDRPFQRDFWQRIIDFRRISFGWYLVIFLYTPVKSGLAALIDVLSGGHGIAPEAVSRFAVQPLLIVPTLFFWLLFGPVPEEPGWRGYALDGLQAQQTALKASLIVGVVWSLWHLPLFFIAGTWQAEQVGLGTQRFWFYLITIVVEAVLYTWIYNNTRSSTLSAILFHFVGNAFGELFALSARAEIYNFVLGVAAVAVVIAIWGPRTLTRGSAVGGAP
ncbi:MAG: CPBP family intramembrane metalloprotease [Anaerolineae bacterium]|nr:CPBP family intramembrane metalloprotease [Anaerolineae bacterium]